MIPRHRIPVDALRPVTPKVVIRVSTSGVGFTCLSETGEVLATCISAKRLSDWAFQHGAVEVRHSYDLRLSDGEP